MAPAPAVLLEATGLVKHYPKVKAVDGVSLQLHAGTCLGLLGPNGAGKSTTIEMLEGSLQPTAGTIRYRGEPWGNASGRSPASSSRRPPFRNS